LLIHTIHLNNENPNKTCEVSIMAQLDQERMKKKRWVKRWEPHKHCLVCALAIPPDKEFCSTTCEKEYMDWKNKQKGKNKNTWVCMILVIVVMVVMMFLLPMLMGG
jgi:predicted nucleic acid-binding Zn ribbon protein